MKKAKLGGESADPATQYRGRCGSIPGMDIVEPGAFGIGLVVTAMMALQAAWYVGVAFMLWKIWAKVRHLPS